MIADDAFSRSEPPYYFTSLPDVPMLDVSRRVLLTLHKRHPEKIARDTTPIHRIWFGMREQMPIRKACGDCQDVTNHAALLRNATATWFLVECLRCLDVQPWSII